MAREKYGGGTIVICDYDLGWPAQFEQERDRLWVALGSVVIAIEHIGSTAVPGLAAKPMWSGISTLTAKLAIGGPFWGQQGFPDAFLDETLTVV